MPVIRALSMPEALVDILADHLARAGLTGANADSFVFPAPGGGHLSYANYRGRRWQPATTEAGVAGVGFHDLGRTATTQLVLGNVELRTAGTRLGISAPCLTLAVLAYATTGADRAATDTARDRFAAAMRVGDASGEASGDGDSIATEATGRGRPGP